jgi:hypothetical protein
MIATLDDLWRRMVKARDQGFCRIHIPAICENLGTEAHHAFEKGSSREVTRWMLDNGCSSCPSCHRWAHANKAAFRLWWRDQIGDVAFVQLEYYSKNAGKPSLQNLEDLILAYRGSV